MPHSGEGVLLNPWNRCSAFSKSNQVWPINFLDLSPTFHFWISTAQCLRESGLPRLLSVKVQTWIGMETMLVTLVDYLQQDQGMLVFLDFSVVFNTIVSFCTMCKIGNGGTVLWWFCSSLRRSVALSGSWRIRTA